MKRADAQRLLLMGAEDRARMLAIEATRADLPRGCLSTSCSNPLRHRGGVGTGGPCRCSPFVLAAAHVAYALMRLDAPSAARYLAHDMPEDGP